MSLNPDDYQEIQRLADVMPKQVTGSIGVLAVEHIPEAADLVLDAGPEIEDVLYEDRVNVNDFYV